MHAPMRTCVGCRAVRPQAELLRSRLTDLCADKEQVLPDQSVRTCAKRHGLSASGRSAYVCPTRACMERAARRGGFARAFGRKTPAVDPAALWNAHDDALARMIDLLNRSGGITAAPRVQRLAAVASAMRAAVGRIC